MIKVKCHVSFVDNSGIDLFIFLFRDVKTSSVNLFLIKNYINPEKIVVNFGIYSCMGKNFDK